VFNLVHHIISLNQLVILLMCAFGPGL